MGRASAISPEMATGTLGPRERGARRHNFETQRGDDGMRWGLGKYTQGLLLGSALAGLAGLGSAHAADITEAAKPFVKAVAPQFENRFKLDFYGILDSAYLYRTNLSRDASNPPANGLASKGQFISGGFNQSRLGIKGAVALTDGWKAVFQLEKGINLYNGSCEDGLGNCGDRFFNRLAWTGFEHDVYGRFSFGRNLSTAYDNFLQFDPMRYAPAFSWLPATGTTTPAGNFPRFTTRVDQNLKYWGHWNLGAVNLELGAYYAFGQKSFNEVSQGCACEDHFSAQAGAHYGVGGIVEFGRIANYPFAVMGVYDRWNGTNTLAAPTYFTRDTYGAAAAWGDYRADHGEQRSPLVLKAGWRNTKFNTAAGTTIINSNMYWGGAGIKLAPQWEFIVADYYEVEDSAIGGGGNMIVASLNFHWMKGVDVYLTYAHANTKNSAPTGLEGAGVIRAGDDPPTAGVTTQNAVAAGARLRF